MTQPKLDEWLTRTAWNPEYWAWVDREAKRLNSDGCTGVLDIFVWTCREHDCHYRLHTFLDGAPITWDQANYVLRERIRQVKVKWYNPLTWIKNVIAWERWEGVEYVFAFVSKEAWEKGEK